MPGHGLHRGAYRKVAPFVFVGLVCILPAAAAPLCPADRIDERVAVAHVHDGDTVRLRDGRDLRFIGVDTPELGREGRAAEPLAAEARAALVHWLATSPRLLLRHDKEVEDRYGRRLAHAYLENGDSVAARLLADGLAVTLVVPPNLHDAQCRSAYQRAAQLGRRGLWDLPEYQSVPATDIMARSSGFRRIKGRITRVSEHKGDLWLHLGPTLAVHVARADRGLVALAPEGLQGVRVQVQGEVRPGKRRAYLRIRHPGAITVVP